MPSPKSTFPKRLRRQQRQFVEEYLIDLNGTQAAIRAGYSARTARFQASWLLTTPNVQAALVKAQEARSRRTEITQDTVLKKIAELAFTDLSAFVKWQDGNLELIDLADIPKEKIPALQEITETREGLRIKLTDRMGALTLLARYLRLLPTPGSRDDPLHHDVTMKEEELDLSRLSDEQLRQYQDIVGAILAAQELTASSTQQGS